MSAKCFLRFACLSAFVAFASAAQAYFSFSWQAPTQVSSGTPYNVSVEVYHLYDDFTATLARNGTPVASDWCWGGSSVTLSAGYTDNGAQTVDYYAHGETYYGDVDSSYHSVTISSPNTPPSVGIAVDGRSYNETITRPNGGSVTITVRYTASDANGNLRGIRPNIWNATTGYFFNNDNQFVTTGGNSGEVVRNVTLDSDGEWYFWTDAEDTAGGYNSTGAWQSGFRLNVTQGPPPNRQPMSSLSVSSTNITFGQGITLTTTITDADGNLGQQAVDVSTDNVNWNSGWNNWSGQTAWNISGSSHTATVSFTPPSAGTYYFRSRGVDNGGWLSEFVSVQVAVARDTQGAVGITPASQEVTVGQSVSFTASGGSGTGAFGWAGDAAGQSGSSATVTFSTIGPRTVSVYRAQDTNYNQSNTATASITVNPVPVQPPVITSPASASGTQGVFFSYQITATNSPANFSTSALPTGLTCNTSTGIISGAPAFPGTFSVNLYATNSGGTGSSTLTLSFGNGTSPDTTNQNQLNVHLPLQQ